METMQIDILNPKAAKLLKDLADLNLIAIRTLVKNDFDAILQSLRSRADVSPEPNEIIKELELVRAGRYAKK